MISARREQSKRLPRRSVERHKRNCFYSRDLWVITPAISGMGECHSRHRHQEFLRFLRRLDAGFPGDVRLHLIMDTYGTYKHAKVKRG